MEAGAVWANVFLEALNSMKLISESALSTLETIVIWAAAFNVFELQRSKRTSVLFYP